MQQITIFNPTYTYLNKRQWKQKGKGESPLASENVGSPIYTIHTCTRTLHAVKERQLLPSSANAGCQPHTKIKKNVLAPPTVGLSTR